MDNSSVRLWFVSDIHASNACFRKFINFSDNTNKPNVLIIGGDITGKYVVPIVDRGAGTYSIEQSGAPAGISSGEVGEIKKQLEDSGCYVYECDVAQYAQFKSSPSSRQEIFDGLAKQRLREWIAFADTRLAGREDCQIIINAGNDDPLYVDEILDSSKMMKRAEGEVLDLPAGMKLVSTGYSNMSPWKCPRDEEEAVLKERISQMTKSLRAADARRTIFNLHCPPKNTLLDLAPALEEGSLRKIMGPKGPVMSHVGSTAVREVIEAFQPVASLHGHIHTGTGIDHIDRTTCFNPGSDYSAGTLQGVFVIFNSDGELVFHHFTNEREAAKKDYANLNWLDTMLCAFSTPYRQYVVSQKDQMETKAKAPARGER